jgi:hypothetical protein
MSSSNGQLVGSARRIWEQGVADDPRLKEPSDVACVYALLRCCQGKADCWPSNQYLAKQCRMSPRGLQNVTRRLIVAGVIAEKKDANLKTGRRLVIVSHPEAKRVLEGSVVECARGVKPFRAKVGTGNNSSDSSLRSESSSLQTAIDEGLETEIPQEIVDQVKLILDPADIAEVIRDRRLIARKAKGRWKLVISVARWIKRRRHEIRGVIPYMASLLESWHEGIPKHVQDAITPPKPPDLPKMPHVTQEQIERRAWWDAYYARKAAQSRERLAGVVG